jgi:SAM-dependent methyltransferase
MASESELRASANDELLWRQLSTLPAFRALLRTVEARFYLMRPPEPPVLDLGCGDGHFAEMAFTQPPDIGIDPSPRSLAEARHRASHRLLAVTLGDALPVPDASYQTVVSNSVLEHIPVLEPVIAEVARILRPGGALIFTTPSEYFLEYLSIAAGLRRARLGGLAQRYALWFNRIARHHHCDSPQVWHARLEAAGFEVVQWQYYFSRASLRALEWGHYLGAPSLVSKVLFGRWILAPSRANLWLTERWMRRYDEPEVALAPRPPAEGAYLYFEARKK